MNKKNRLFLFFVIISSALFSQEISQNDLTTNQVLVGKWNELKAERKLKKSFVTDTISMDTVSGIIEDFSYDYPYPDTALWLDNQVYINRGYPIAPITIGAATFDGLNANGYPYNFSASTSSSNGADTLTSKPINLLNYIHNTLPVNYTLNDSLYFSFFYQPQGRGNAPEPRDSLVLEFRKAGSTTTWQKIWSKGGSPVPADSSWKLVMIPIKDAGYLQKGFQFRFRNYATTCGNLDHWSLDYIYLNKFRTVTDTLFEDVSFVYNTPSLLKTYSAMPWNHYQSANMASTLPITIRSNFNLPKFSTFDFDIYDSSGTIVSPHYSGGSDNIDPYATSGYLNYTPFTNPTLGYAFPAPLTVPTLFTFKAYLYSSPDKKRANDTLLHVQKFSNYYAYDDETAESALGLSTLGAQMAEQFTSTITDTLQCIDIYFNPVITNASQYTFRLNVWNDNGGKPGTAIYTNDTVQTVVYNQTGYSQFTRYYLSSPLYLSAGTFYVGFTQNTNQFLNVGVDKNRNTQNKTFYNVAGSWDNPPFTGSLMIHPVFGAKKYLTEINEIVSKNNNELFIYPNPANDKLYVKTKNNLSEKVIYSIIDLFGRVVYETKSTMLESIDVSALSSGVYFLRTISDKNTFTNKFIISR